MLLKDSEGYTIDAGTHHIGPDRLLVTISNPREESIAVSLRFTQVVRMVAEMNDWLSAQAAKTSPTPE